MMFALPFGRVLWKEYRSNRALWLSCLVIGGCLQLWAMIWSAVDHTTNIYCDGQVWGFACGVPVLYAIGCGAVLFAGEREYSTANWLLSISAPPAITFVSKLSFAIASTIALQIVLSLSASAIAPHPSPDVLAQRFMPWGLVMLIWSTLGALLSRRVLVSVFAMAFWFLIPAWILNLAMDAFLGTFYSFNDKFLHRQYVHGEIHLWLLGIVTLLVDFWIGYRWCCGQYCDGAVFEGLGDNGGTLWRHITGRKAAPIKLLSQVESEHAWRRSWQRLVWQERRRERVAYRLPMIVCPLIALSRAITLLCGATFAPQFDWFWMTCLIVTSSLLVGALSVQDDAHCQQSRFIASRGISPGMLWAAKQYVWLPRAFLLFMAVSLIVLCGLWQHSHFDATDAYVMNAIIFGADVNRSESVFTLRLGFWYVLLGYALGQLGSLLFRRTVLSIGFGYAIVILFQSWISLIVSLQIGLWWSIGLPVVAVMLITVWQIKFWLLEDDSWWHRGKVFASMLAIPLVMFLALSIARVAEVWVARRLNPGPDFWFEQQLQSALEQKSNPEENKTLLAQLLDLSNPDRSRIQESAKEIIRLISNHQDAAIWTDPPENLGRGGEKQWLPYKLKQVLHAAAADWTTQEKFEESLECYVTTLKLAGHVGRGGAHNWWLGATMQRECLEDLVDWSNHPSQSAQSIRNAIKTLESELSHYPAVSSQIVNWYLRDDANLATASTQEIIERVRHSGSVHDYETMRELSGWSMNPTECWRSRILLTRGTELMLLEAQVLERQFSLESRRASGTSDYDFCRSNQYLLTEISKLIDMYQSLYQTTPVLHLSVISDLITQGGVSDVVKSRCADVRAGLIRMALTACRHETGKLPERVTDLIPGIDPNVLIDPWTGRNFEYYPAFLLAGGLSDDQVSFVSENRVRIVSSHSVRSKRTPRFNESTPLRDLFFVTQGSYSTLNTQTAEMRELKRWDGVHQPMTSLFPIPPDERSKKTD